MDQESEESRNIGLVFVMMAIAILHNGNIKSIGVLLPSLQEHFHTNTQSIGTAVSFLLLSGSIIVILVQPLARIYSIRRLVMISGFLTSIGLLVCSCAFNIYVLVFGIFLAGFSDMAFILTFASISTYFHKYYHVACSLYLCGVSFGIISFAPLTQFFNDLYGWRGSVLLLSALNLNLINAAACLKPRRNQNQDEASSKTSSVKKIMGNYITEILKLSLLKNKQYIVIAVVHMISGYCFNGWMVYMMSIGLSKGLASDDSAIMVLISGVGILAALITLAILPTNKWYRQLLYAGSILMTIAYGGLYFASSFTALCVQSCMLGIGYGVVGTVLYIGMNESLEPEDINGGMAWMMFTESSAYILGGFTSGLLFDMTGSYDVPLIGLTFISLFIALIIGAEDIWDRLKLIRYSKLPAK